METSLHTPTHTPHRLLGIWSHPDDEAYLAAGLMGRVVDSGGSVTLVAVTDGEGGFDKDDPRSETTRASVRREELTEAMARIGVTDIRFLGVADGHVAEADSFQIVESLVSIIAEVDPHDITTFGPDGITGHEDHIVTGSLVTQAWLRAPHGTLWYAAKTERWLDEWRELHDDFGVWMTDEPTGVADDALELVVGLDADELARKRSVLAAHASQTAGLSAAFGEDRYCRWVQEETFRRPTAPELAAADPYRAIANWCHPTLTAA